METQIRTIQQLALAEFIGTFWLVFWGTGAIIFHDLVYPIGAFGISLAFGLAVYTAILLVGKISGAHLNPAVSLLFFWRKELNQKTAIAYISAQFLGAILASFILKLIAPTHLHLGSTFPHCGTGLSLILECFMTIVLCAGILYFATSKWEKWTGAVASSIVFLEAFFGGSFTGASMNPARSLGPALASFQLEDVWIYILAPSVGAWLAVLLFKKFNFSKQTPTPSNSAD
jgi:MIP family channel proteins